MTVDVWIHDAVKAAGPKGATVRDVQRWIDEHRHEELAVDTIEVGLARLVEAGHLEQVGNDRWTDAPKLDADEAAKRLFGG